MTCNRIVMLFLSAAVVFTISAGVVAADEVNVTLEGHFGGEVDAVAVSGDYAYIGMGQDFVVLDITNPAAPSELGKLRSTGVVVDITVAGNYAYVANCYNGLVIVDVSNKAAPALTGSYDTAGYAQDVAVAGNYAYVADFYNGLVIVDVSNKAAPTLAGRYHAGQAGGVAVAGNYAYVTNGSAGLEIVDVSNKAAPTLAGRYDTAGSAHGVAVAGNYAYVADRSNGLVIVDVSNKAAPTLAGCYDTAGWAFDVVVAGDYAYVADFFDGLVIVDVSNKAAPTLAGRYHAGDAGDVAVAGNYAYVANCYNGLVIVDINDKTAPALAGRYDTAGHHTEGVAVAGNYAYCRVPKLFRQETSPQLMVKLTDKKIKWAVTQVINKGESTELVAAVYGVYRRRIQQLVKYYRGTGEYPMLDKKRRPKTHLSNEEKRIIEDAYNESFLGARLLRFHIQKHYKRNISHNKIHQHLLEVGLAIPNLKKQKI